MGMETTLIAVVILLEGESHGWMALLSVFSSAIRNVWELYQRKLAMWLEDINQGEPGQQHFKNTIHSFICTLSAYMCYQQIP